MCDISYDLESLKSKYLLLYRDIISVIKEVKGFLGESYIGRSWSVTTNIWVYEKGSNKKIYFV